MTAKGRLMGAAREGQVFRGTDGRLHRVGKTTWWTYPNGRTGDGAHALRLPEDFDLYDEPVDHDERFAKIAT